MIEYIKKSDKEKCYGCRACELICKHSAISMESDSEGFLYPTMNVDKCIKCGLCVKVCPISNPKYKTQQQDVYACWSKNDETRMQSSSGGLFSEIAKYILDRGGIVFGAATDKKAKLYVRHIGIETIEDLKLLKGSKYVQSDLNTVYEQIKGILREKRLVYFTGTPCQVAGLYSFLGKDDPNLFTTDLVCHGVPSYKLFKYHIEYIESKYKAKLINYSFRDLSKWGIKEQFKYQNKKGKTKSDSSNYEFSPYLLSFKKSMVNRQSCYACQFARPDRTGDITLADFWGIKRFFPNIDPRKGASLLITNSNRGDEVFKAIKDNLISLKSNFEDASSENHNLRHPTPKPFIRDSIYQQIEELGYENVSKKYFTPKKPLVIKSRYIVIKMLDLVGIKNLITRMIKN